MFMPTIFRTNFVNDFFDDKFWVPVNYETNNVKEYGMSADVKEYDDRFELDLELQGYKKEDIKAELKEGYLNVSAEHSEEKEEKDEIGKYIRKERYTGSTMRRFYVGKDITKEDIRANFENGILKIDIPKKEPVAIENKNQCIAIG